jgi:hypothetical protein
MNFFKYIGINPVEFQRDYVNEGYVNRQTHNTFPLDILTYSRKAVTEQKWDGVTSKCRGIIIHRETGEVIARPFEKFHNFGAAEVIDRQEIWLRAQPVIWEKMDGFLCTAYRWEGQWYVASKGSFHSIHAKWATVEFNKQARTFPEGWTPVFEGLSPDLRIVVDYKERNELILLAVIENETGAEYPPAALQTVAEQNGFKTPGLVDMTWQRALQESKEVYKDGLGTDEGFVLTWYSVLGGPPARLKVKYDEYFRLHRIVTGVSARRVWEVMSSGDTETLKTWLQGTTPWFAKFAKRWMAQLTDEFEEVRDEAKLRFERARLNMNYELKAEMDQTGGIDAHLMRKSYAARFTSPENKKYAPVMFAMLDNKDPNPVIWKMVRHVTNGVNPIVDAHNL